VCVRSGSLDPPPVAPVGLPGLRPPGGRRPDRPDADTSFEAEQPEPPGGHAPPIPWYRTQTPQHVIDRGGLDLRGIGLCVLDQAGERLLDDETRVRLDRPIEPLAQDVDGDGTGVALRERFHMPRTR
jgi:hypothetical protein